MAESDNINAIGPTDPEAIGRIGSGRVFPGELTQAEFIAANRPSIEALADPSSPEYAARVDQLYEQALRGEYNVNTVMREMANFNRDVIPPDILEQAKAATKREKEGSQTPEDVALLTELRNPQGTYRTRFNKVSRGAPDFISGIRTGTFSISPVDGGAIIPEGVDIQTNVVDVPSRLTRKAQESRNLLAFVQSHPQQPVDEEVREAILEAFDMTWQDAFVDGVKEMGRFGAMGGFHLGYFLGNTFTDDEGNFRFDLHGNPRDRAIAFEKFRKSGSWIDSRKEIVDEIIREQLRFKLGDEEFNRRGYGEKVKTEDGDEVYKVQFVTDQFAEDVSEFMYDQLTWKEQMLTVIGEGAVAYNVVKWPFKGLGLAKNKLALARLDARDKLVRLGGRVAETGGTRPSADVFRILPRDRQRKVAETVAASRGIPVEEAARNLATRNKHAGWWHNFRAGMIGGAVAEASAVRKLATLNDESAEIIDTLRDSYRNALRDTGRNSPEALMIREKLNMEIARSNNRALRLVAPNLRQFGINPMFDLTFGLAQVHGRQYFGGPIGELYGVGIVFSAFAAGKGLSFLANKTSFTQTAKVRAGGAIGGTFNDLAYLAKTGVEETATFGLKLLTAYRYAEADGLLRGFITNPNLRYLTNLSSAETARLPLSIRTELDKFTKRLKRLPQGLQDLLVDNLSEAIDDVHIIVDTIPRQGSTPEMTQRLTQIRADIEGALAVHMGEASGINLFFAMNRATTANRDGVTEGGALAMNKQAQQVMTKRRDAENRVASLSLAQQRIEAEILNLRDIQSTAVGGEAAALNNSIDRLTELSQSFARASEFASAEFAMMLATDASLAAKELDMLADPANLDLAQDALTSGHVEDLIRIVRNAEDRFLTSADNPNNIRIDQFEGESRFLPGEKLREQLPQTTVTVEALREQARNADMIVRNFEANLVNYADKIRFTQSETLVQNTADTVLHGFTVTARAQSEEVVSAAYDEIPDELSVNFSGFALGIDKFLRAYAADYESKLTLMADPTKFAAFGGRAGENLYNSLDQGARRGMIAFFEANLDVFSSALKPGKEFTTGREVLEHFKTQVYGTKDKAYLLENFGVEDSSRLTNLQIMLKILDDAEQGVLPDGIKFSSFNFAVKPKELEELRQGANYLRMSTKPNTPRNDIATLLVSKIDETFDEWGQGLNEVSYNAVVRARTIARMEAQRYDRGSIADAIERIHAINQYKTLGGSTDDPIFDLTVKSESDLLKPLVDAILDGGDNAPSIIQREMRRIRTSFAPISGELPENILVQGADGKVRMPTDKEISKMTTAVMSEEDFTRLSAVVNVQVKARIARETGLKNIDTFIEKNELPRIIGDDNFPQALEIPIQYGGNLLKYLEDVDARSVVMVRNPETGAIEPRQLINSFDIYQADRDITAVVNSSAKFQSVHAELVQNANVYVKESGAIVEQTKRRTEEVVRAIMGVSENTSGDKFYVKYIDSGNETSVRQIVALTRDNDFLAKGNFTDREMQQGLQAVFVQVLRSVGDVQPPRNKTVRLFNGVDVAVETYSRPDQAFALIDDALSGSTIQGRNFAELADAAGVSEDQLKTLRAVFRFATRMEGERIYAQMGDQAPTLKQATSGFNMDNALSRAFNLARGMVSVQFVAAEVALRYAALSNGAAMQVILSDERAARIIHDALKDVDLVTEDRARYLADTVMRVTAISTADMLKEIEKQDPDFAEYAQEYWENVGVLTPEYTDRRPD